MRWCLPRLNNLSTVLLLQICTAVKALKNINPSKVLVFVIASA